MDKNVNILGKPLPSARSGAFFNAFSYPTKISPESILEEVVVQVLQHCYARNQQ